MALLFRQGRHAEALALVDYDQAKGLRAKELQAAQFVVGDTQDPKQQLLRRTWQLQAELEVLQRMLAVRSDTAPDKGQVVERIEQLRTEQARAAAQLPAATSVERSSGPALLSRVRAALEPSPNTQLLVSFASPSHVYLWLIDRTGVIEAHATPLLGRNLNQLKTIKTLCGIGLHDQRECSTEACSEPERVTP